MFNNPDLKEIDRDRWCEDFKSLRTGKTMDDGELNTLLHPDQTATFEGIKQKKDLIKEKYLQIKPETINLLFKKANQRLSTDKSVTESDIWSRDPIPPIRLIYNSAKNYGEFECIVYPVCFYYIKRAPYLFAYGTNPNNDEINWYDYRADRILKLEELRWEDIKNW